MIYFFFFESYCVLYGAPKGTSVEKTYVISFPRNHFVRTKYVISFPRNVIRHHEIYHIIIYYHIYISYIYISGHNLPDKSCVADTAMQIELA